MPEFRYEGYIVKKPLYNGLTGIKNRQSPMTFLSNRLLPEVNYYLELGWIYGIPQPNPHIQKHTHNYDEILLHWGGSPEKPQNLGAEIELQIGGQTINFNTTTCIFIPRGTPHGPVIWKEFSFPHIQMSLMLGTGSPPVEAILPEEAPLQPNRLDYEQYVVRSPIREAGRGYYKSGRQCPTMTYMSEDQVNASKIYLEFGWIWDIVEPNIGEMVHNRVDEIVMHIGGEPENHEDLGADLEIGLGGELFTVSSSNAAFIPKGLRHGPVTWKKVRKPHIQMAIMLGAGSYKEGWGDAFFDQK